MSIFGARGDLLSGLGHMDDMALSVLRHFVQVAQMRSGLFLISWRSIAGIASAWSRARLQKIGGLILTDLVSTKIQFV